MWVASAARLLPSLGQVCLRLVVILLAITGALPRGGGVPQACDRVIRTETKRVQRSTWVSALLPQDMGSIPFDRTPMQIWGGRELEMGRKNSCSLSHRADEAFLERLSQLLSGAFTKRSIIEALSSRLNQ
jgi:hypothetical protein